MFFFKQKENNVFNPKTIVILPLIKLFTSNLVNQLYHELKAK